MSRNDLEVPIDWERERAESRAIHGFYRALGEQARRAGRGEALLPMIPPLEELVFVDGFLVWNGRPVWWSGEPGSSAGREDLEGPGLINPEATSRPLPIPRRRRLGRFLHALGLI
jgi:hypothetical protein